MTKFMLRDSTLGMEARMKTIQNYLPRMPRRCGAWTGWAMATRKWPNWPDWTRRPWRSYIGGPEPRAWVASGCST